MTPSVVAPDPVAHAATTSRLALGVDFGKVTTCIALGEIDACGELRIVQASAERHLGEPIRPFAELYGRLDVRRLSAIAATGVYGERLADPAIGGLPEEIAQEQAADWLYPDGPINVVRIGGGGYSVLTRDARGRVRFEANERCSAGTGETVEGLCSRLGRSLEDAVELARSGVDAVTVTSRCAVFAKSELTHFANQGEPHGRIFRGLFAGVARNVHSLCDKNKVRGPVLLIGHGALIAPIAEELAELSDLPVSVAAEAGVFEALGALRHAATCVASHPPTFPTAAAALLRPHRRRIRRLRPAKDGLGSVVRLDEPHEAPPGPDAPAVLGLDLGSTGSKAALLDAVTGVVLASVYRRTEGNPVEAAQALVAQVVETAPNPVLAVGLTGSGRDAAATVFRAAYPELGDRIVVHNEIVAHAVAASRLDPDAGRSLSVVEIGGQDAKFINVEGGRVVDADMNRVCSAGTGSFLEEQALAHGVDDIVEFGRLAARSEGPPDLGQTCTVFVADVAAEALGDGFSREDIFAGLQQSVVRNYRSRVMGQRRLLGRVFFQGKPATDPSLARTLAAVLEREVYVPADPGVMGAVGVALLASLPVVGAGRDHGGVPAVASGLPPIDLRRVLGARVSGRREFRCKDGECRNLCRLELAEIEVAGAREKVVSGGQCPKYDAVSAAGEKLPKDAPNPFRQREELLRAELSEVRVVARAIAGPRVGLPYVHYLVDTLPFFHTFLRSLGYDVTVLRPDDEALAEGDRRCGAPGGCTPVKLLHGVAAADVDVLMAPVFVHLPLPNAGATTYTCPMAQGAPDMVGRALWAEGSRTRVLRPVLFEKEGADFSSPQSQRTLLTTARALAEVSPGRPLPSAAEGRSAAAAASAAQRRFEAGLRRIGEDALAWARAHGHPVVLVAGETHVIHDAVLDAGIHDLVAANGAVPLPVDCYPVPGSVPGLRRVHWAGAGQTLRAMAAGIEAGDVFPLLLGAYGCGPNSMIEHLVDDIAGDWPHAVLESDGHGGKAGYVTRVQAFLHSVRGWRAGDRGERRKATADRAVGAGVSSGSAPGAATDRLIRQRLERYDRPLPHSLEEGCYERFFYGHVGGGLGRHLAAAMRGAGLDAVYVGEADAAALREAGAVCSGKECLPYQLIWGTLARFLQNQGPGLNGHKALFLSAGSGFQACRANLFPFTEQLVLDRLGKDIDVGDFGLVTASVRMMPVAWTALVAVDLLNMVRFYHLAVEQERGAADRLFTVYSERLERMLERPRPDSGLAGNVAGALRFCGEVEELLGQASRDFRELTVDEGRAGDLRDVYLCGDIYLRVDEWGNDDLQRKLADHGLRVIFEPFGEFFELLQLRQIQDGVPLRKRPEKEATLFTMRYVVRRLLAAVRRDHPWAFWHDVRAVDRESRRLTSGYPFGETIPIVGGALLAWETQPVDGVVSVAPRGCGPALIAEAQLRREPGLPSLFVYNDGDPIDEARLAGFAWRLRSRPARRPPA